MKKSCVALAVMGALLSLPASAKLQTYTFTGVIDSMSVRIHVPTEWGPEWQYYETTSSQSWYNDISTGNTLKVGERFSGSVTFDDVLVKGENAQASYSIAFEHGVADAHSGTQVWRYGGSSPSIGFSGQYVSFGFGVPSLEDAGTPAVLNLAGATVNGYWQPGNGEGAASFVGRMDSLVNVTPVPEPSTYAMLIGGLMLVGARARRLRAQRAA